MNSETLLKYRPKKTQVAGQSHWNYFRFSECSANSEEIFSILGFVNVLAQGFISTFGLSEIILKKGVEGTVEKARDLGIDAPSKNVLESCSLVISMLNRKGFNIDFINPSKDGGVILELTKDSVYYLFEFFNDGDIVFLKRNGQSREVFDLDKKSLIEYIQKI